MAQVHKAKLSISCELEIPQFQKNKGIHLELMANDSPLGEIQVMGAHVYFRAAKKQKWKQWSFTDFVKLLEAS